MAVNVPDDVRNKIQMNSREYRSPLKDTTNFVLDAKVS